MTEVEPAFTPRGPTPPINLNPLRLTSNAWTGATMSAAITAEEALFSKHIRSPYELGKVKVELPQLGLGTQYVNTLHVNADVEDGVPIVLTHGAGGGIGFFYSNIEALANLGGVRRRLLAFDWLGCALSSRPSYPYGGFAKPSFMLSEEEKIDAAIRFSVESLEAWRQAMSLERMDLLAHSMGGYLATQYAMRYPQNVRRLVLISPVGWAEQPKGAYADSKASGLFGALWASGLGNFGFAKVLGRAASQTARNAVVGRLGIDDDDERRLLGEYFWNALCAQPVSGEQAVNYLLVPYVPPAPFGFYARRPVSTERRERLAALPPTTLLYGSHDLHYIPTMPQAVKAVQACSSSTVRMAFVSNSDHHLYVDNPRDFHKQVEKALA